jgi:uncharacterized coiled-coil DUF342 family protein
MEENVKKELDTIRKLIVRWKKSYLGWVDPAGGNDYLLEEFSEEISTYVSPLIRRFWEGNFLTRDEVHEFLEDCYSQVNELRDLIEEVEAEQQNGSMHELLKVMGNTK